LQLGVEQGGASGFVIEKLLESLCRNLLFLELLVQACYALYRDIETIVNLER